MSFVLLGILNSQAAAGGAGSYWISTAGSVGNDRAYSVTTDSSGNIYAFGNTSGVGAGSNDQLLAKWDSAGVVQWEKTLGGTGSDQGRGVRVDSAGNVYTVGWADNSANLKDNDLSLVKYDSSGVIQWQVLFGATAREYGYSLEIDSSDNIYVSGVTQSDGPGPESMLIAKYNTAGTLQWQRILGGAGQEEAFGITTDLSGNVYVFGSTESIGQGSKDWLLAKYDSAGTIQWQRALGGTGTDFAEHAATDSFGNIYTIGYTNSTGAGSYDLLIAKWSTSGSLLWQKTLGGSVNDLGYDIAIDSADNIYVAGYTASSGAGSNDYLIVKYNTAGTIQWQRTLGGVLSDLALAITVDSSGDIIVTGSMQSAGEGSSDIGVARLPGDGSLTGAYRLDGADIVYQASSLTSGTSFLTYITGSLTSSTPTFSSTASGLTLADAGLVSHITEGQPYAAFITNELAVTEAGVPYSQSIDVAVESMATTVEYSLFSGTLPAGLSFDTATHTISGTSTESAGTVRTFTIRAVCSNGLTVDKAFSIGAVIAPKITGSSVTVINAAPYTHQYYVIRDSQSVSTTTSISNAQIALVGGGASGTYVQNSANTYGGYGGQVRYYSGISWSAQQWGVTIGNGGSYTFGSSNPGSQTTGFGYTANGGQGITQTGVNGSNAAASIISPIASQIYSASDFANYTGLAEGYLGGSGSGATLSNTPRPAGLGGGGTGIYYDNGGLSGLYYSGGGGGGGGKSGGASGVGSGGGKGSIIIAIPNV